MNLTVTQRDRLLAILPKYEQKATGRRRADPVKVFEGILFVLETGCPRVTQLREGRILTNINTLRSRPATATFKNGFKMEPSSER